MTNRNILLTTLTLFVLVGLYAQPEAGMPAEPGKCYAKCLIADQYETFTEEVLIKEASTKVATVPARYETVSEQLLAKEGGNTLAVSPATFETATEQVLVQDGGKSVSIMSASFETLSEQVIKAVNAPGLSVVPAAFETVSEQVLVQDAFTRLVVVPATFETVTEQTLVQEAYNELRVVPATYETVVEQILIKEGYSVVSQAPPITDLEGLRKMIADEGNSYRSSRGITRSFNADEIAALKGLAGISTVLSADKYGNVYATISEQVLEKEGYSTISTAPAKYEFASEQVLAKEGGTKIERTSAGYNIVSEAIQTSPVSTKWVKKKASKNCLSANPEDCLVWCLVEVPAQFRTVTKQVLKPCGAGWTSNGEDCVRTTEIPAVYETRSFQRLSSKASSNKSEVGALYGTRTYKRLISPASTISYHVPAQYGTRSYRKVATSASTTSSPVAAQYTSRSIQKLVNAASTQVEEIPARYETRIFKKLVTDATSIEIACGKSSVLEGINFQSGSAQLTASSSAEIDRLETMLKSKSAVTARLVGHTDDQGSATSNQKLSERRAKAVFDALVSAGVIASRLSYDGLGETEPIANNTTGTGRRTNRRTEFITFGDDASGGDCTLYDTRTYQKLTTDAGTLSSDIAAQYTTRSFQKLVLDADVSSSSVPVSYTTRSYQKLSSDASVITSNVPAKYNTVTRRNLVKAGGFTEWREVVCDSDVTPAFYRRIQQALIDKGYNIGIAGADGVIGVTTKAALVQYQKDNGLPIGQIDVETMKSLAVQR